MVTAPGRMLLGAYRGAPRRERLHVRARWLSCPFGAVEAHVPPAGEVLDLGCGHGLFSLLMASATPERQVTGIDVDGKKIDLARQAAASLGLGNVRFEVGAAADLANRHWDAVTIVDVLYLLGSDRAERVVAAAAGALTPGGVALIKEMDRRPRWKHRLNQLQELTATRVTRITAGDHVDVVPPDRIVAALEQAGLAARRQRLDRHRLHPHLLITAQRVGIVTKTPL